MIGSTGPASKRTALHVKLGPADQVAGIVQLPHEILVRILQTCGWYEREQCRKTCQALANAYQMTACTSFWSLIRRLIQGNVPKMVKNAKSGDERIMKRVLKVIQTQAYKKFQKSNPNDMVKCTIYAVMLALRDGAPNKKNIAVDYEGLHISIDTIITNTYDKAPGSLSLFMMSLLPDKFFRFLVSKQRRVDQLRSAFQCKQTFAAIWILEDFYPWLEENGGFYGDEEDDVFFWCREGDTRPLTYEIWSLFLDYPYSLDSLVCYKPTDSYRRRHREVYSEYHVTWNSGNADACYAGVKAFITKGLIPLNLQYTHVHVLLWLMATHGHDPDIQKMVLTHPDTDVSILNCFPVRLLMMRYDPNEWNRFASDAEIIDMLRHPSLDLTKFGTLLIQEALECDRYKIVLHLLSDPRVDPTSLTLDIIKCSRCRLDVLDALFDNPHVLSAQLDVEEIMKIARQSDIPDVYDYFLQLFDICPHGDNHKEFLAIVSAGHMHTMDHLLSQYEEIDPSVNNNQSFHMIFKKIYNVDFGSDDYHQNYEKIRLKQDLMKQQLNVDYCKKYVNAGTKLLEYPQVKATIREMFPDREDYGLRGSLFEHCI